MGDYSLAETWLTIFLAALATFIWRFSGLILSDHIRSDSLLMRWINAVAYAMVAAVLVKILFYPGGVLATTSLEHRLIGLFLGLAVMFTTRILWAALVVSMASFALMATFF